MKNYLLIILLVFSSQIIEAQSNVGKKIDSLKTLKNSIQVQIRNLQVDLQNINKQIETLELQKSSSTSTANTITAKVSEGGAIMRDQPNSMGNTVASIPAGQTIQVFREQQNLYFKASYNGKIGYVSYTTLDTNQEIDDYLSGKTKPVQQTSTQTVIRKADENDPKFQKLNKLYGRETAIKIMNREIWQGMSPGMALESVGKPNSKNTETRSDGIIEVWQYNDLTIEFKNGEVKSYTKK